jgi:hypothetical protein
VSREDAAQRSEPARLVHARARVDVVQLLWKYPLADERYVTDSAWKEAILDGCPFHPEGGCGVEKLGSYPRAEPVGVRIPRWWCPKQRASISLLPAFLAARLSGTLDAVEDVVVAVEQAGTIAAAVDVVHPPGAEDAIGLVCALRSIRRRVRAVRAALLAIATLMPERFTGVAPTLAAFREALAGERVLVTLREVAERYLSALPVPLGLRARASG